MPRPSVLVPALLLAIGCRAGSPAPLSDAQRTAIADSVRQMAADLAAGVSARGYRAFPPAMDSAPGYSWAYNGFLAFPSFDSMVAWTRAQPELRAPEVFAWDSVRVAVLAPGIATFSAGYSETAPDSAGSPKTEKGFFTAVALHREGGWKFTNAPTSTLPPPPPPPPPRSARRR
jgi:hypothetical protein